jgi:succinate dehydrogenase / fumarate reductase cytochrome b subunit
MRYRWQLGFWAFLLMRISGVALIFYLMLHIYVLHHLLEGPAAFDELMKTVQSPLFKFFEVALLGAVLYHALNGVRVLWVDFGSAAKNHQPWFWAMISIGIVALIFGAIPILKIL